MKRNEKKTVGHKLLIDLGLLVAVIRLWLYMDIALSMARGSSFQSFREAVGALFGYTFVLVVAAAFVFVAYVTAVYSGAILSSFVSAAVPFFAYLSFVDSFEGAGGYPAIVFIKAVLYAAFALMEIIGLAGIALWITDVAARKKFASTD